MSKETKSETLRRFSDVIRSPIGGFQPGFLHKLLNDCADQLDKKKKKD